MTNQDIKKGKKQISLCNVTVNWQHTEQPNPAFKRLMMLLLKPREGSLVKRKVSNNFQRKTDTETDPETDTDTER